MELNTTQKGELPHGSSPFCQETCLLIVRSDELKFWFDQSKCSVLTSIYNIYFVRLCVTEYIKIMSKKFHLYAGIFRIHWFHAEFFRTDDLDVFVLQIVMLQIFFLEVSCFLLFVGNFVFVFAKLASFNDSVVYCTEIQVLDSTALDKNGFLPKRDLYSYQLKNYLEYDLKKPDYTCMIYFSENKKKLEKEAVKVKAKYKKSTMVLQAITSDKFSFKKPEE